MTDSQLSIDPSLTKLRVALLSGGWSDEREISLQSGDAVERALKEAGFASVERLDIADDDFLARLAKGGFDVAFIAMHGHGGEDGCVQGFFETLHIPYTFSGVEASAVACDKSVAKGVYRAAGIPTPGGMTLDAVAWNAEGSHDVDAILAECGLPALVKPATNGSSFGISKVNRREDLVAAIDAAFERDDKVLVESFVQGTEITVPVIGNDDPQALPIIEVIPGEGAEFYDLKVKYEPSELHHVMPARLPEDVYRHAQELAILAHKSLGCAGASRSDFIVTSGGTPYILETNTIPGMTETSLLPDSARSAGIPFPELCVRFIQMALERH